MFVPHLLCNLLIGGSGYILLIYDVAYRYLFENGPFLYCYSMLRGYLKVFHYLEVYYLCCD